MNNKKTHKSKIGGQALIEGVMMRGIDKASMAVRTPAGEIDLEVWEIQKNKKWWRIFTKTPIIRGVVNFIISMVDGYKCLMKSATKAGLDEEMEAETKFEKFLDRVFGEKLMPIVMMIGGILGVFLSIGLFMLLPTLVVKLLNNVVVLGGFKGIIEGVIKIAIFIAYLALVSRMKEIKRVFEYHGAEHKSIACYEAGEELTPENARKYTRFHPRCGTSFLLIILILSIIIFSVVTWESVVIRTILKITLLPLVVGIAYEIIKLAGRYDNFITRIVSWPGLKLQRLTTNEPDDTQLEIAIAALKAVIPENKEEDQW
ncbi:MAG: DUF1385 domain-containing protein [Oscillospiraceae bacterium]